MKKEEFNKFLDKMFKLYKEPIHLNTKVLLHYKVSDVEKLNNYIIDNLEEHITIDVYGYELRDEDLILKTELGTFVLESYRMNYKKEYYSEEVLNKFVNTKYNILEFFRMLFYNDLTKEPKKYEKEIKVNKDLDIITTKLLVFEYLKAYYIYKMLKDDSYAKRLFFAANNYLFKRTKVRYIPLEYLNNTEFNNYIHTSNNKYLSVTRLKYLYDNYYKFDNNIKLKFSMILVFRDYDKIDFIKNNLSEFKKFVLEEGIPLAYGNKYAKYTLSYLRETGLINEFSKEEKILLYKKNPSCYYEIFNEDYLEIANEIENRSPVIRLNNREDRLVNISYENYHLLDNIPIHVVKKDVLKNGTNFLMRFIYHSDSIAKFYKVYYKSYKNAIKEKLEKDNLEDFIKNLLYKNNLIKIFDNSNFTWDDIESLIGFKKYYDESITKSIEDTKVSYRKKTKAFYQTLVYYDNQKKNIEECLSYYNLNKDNVYEYIINNKFFYSDEKNIMINILNKYFKKVRVLDILLILDEMLTKELTLSQILKEKNISKSAFQSMYQSAKENNPILYEYIFEALNQNSRRGYIKLIRFGYIVLNEELNSLSDYNEKFGDKISFESLLQGLIDTSLYDSLIEKSSNWKDFQIEKPKNKMKTNKN